MNTIPESTTATKAEKADKPLRAPVPRHGVDPAAVFATIGVVRGQPELGAFRFRAKNRWLRGTHSRTTIESFSGAGSEHVHKTSVPYDADHPAVLCGSDEGPTPVEFLLHALAACITAGVANVAAARGVTLTAVESTVEGEIDLRGIFGIGGARNGYQRIRATFSVEGDAPREKLEEILAQSRARSAVFDVLTNGVPVDITFGQP